MKKKRTIVIKTPKLVLIRNNFRKLWIKWSQDIRLNIRKKIQDVDLHPDGKPKALDEMTPQEQELYEQLEVKLSQIRYKLEASICLCTICGRSNRNMTFNPVDQEWYCTQCYEQNKEFFKNTDKADWYP